MSRAPGTATTRTLAITPREKSQGVIDTAISPRYAPFLTSMHHLEAPSRSVRPRLLVVEDSFAVAEALKALLEGNGFDVAGMAGTTEKALHLVRSRDFELAILDIALHGETVAAVASAVQDRGKPVIFLSGYSNVDMLPSHLRGYPRLEKPVDPEALVAVLRESLPQDPGGDGDATIGRSSKGASVR